MIFNIQFFLSLSKHFDLINFLCMIFSLLLCYFSVKIPLKPQKISFSNPLYNYPVQNQTISGFYLNIMIRFCSTLYIFLVFFISYFLKTYFKQFQFFSALWSLFTSINLSLFSASCFKSLVGRPRPDMYHYCGFNSTYESCQYKEKDKEFISWPSYHAASAMSCCLFLSLFTRAIIKSNYLFISLFSYSFIFLGIYIGATRIQDNKHHPDDVTAGLFIGAITTFFIWDQAQKSIFPQHAQNFDISSEDSLLEN